MQVLLHTDHKAGFNTHRLYRCHVIRWRTTISGATCQGNRLMLDPQRDLVVLVGPPVLVALDATEGSIIHNSNLPTFGASAMTITSSKLCSVLLASNGIIYMAATDLLAAVYLNGTAAWSYPWETTASSGIAYMAIFPNGTLTVSQGMNSQRLLFGGGGGCDEGHAPSPVAVTPMNASCDICSPGTYSYRATFCKDCNSGFFSNVTGAASSDVCNACAPGESRFMTLFTCVLPEKSTLHFRV